MTSISINWAKVIAFLTALAGVAGTVLTPIYGSNLAGAVQGVILGVSGLLIAITGYHATSVVASALKLKQELAIRSEFAAAEEGKHAA